jgi:hypothetical protein
VNRSASFNLRDSLAATLAHVTTHNKTLSFVLAYKAESWTESTVLSFI